MGAVRWHKERNRTAFAGQVGKYNSEPQTLKCFSQALHKPSFLWEKPNINLNIIDLLCQWLCRWSQWRSKNGPGRAGRCQSLSKPSNARRVCSHGPRHSREALAPDRLMCSEIPRREHVCYLPKITIVYLSTLKFVSQDHTPREVPRTLNGWELTP